MNCRTLDDPRYSGNDEILKINQVGTIVGYDNGSYVARRPYRPGDYQYLGNYAGAQKTVMTAFGPNNIVVGYVVNPPQLSGTWAFMRINGVWSLLRDRREGKGANSISEILDVNGSNAVGFYRNRHGMEVPFELNSVSEKFTDLKLPGAVGGEATGISSVGDVVGFAQMTADDPYRGFLFESGAYTELSFPAATNTYFWDVSFQRTIVGSYTDTSGNVHGFILSDPTAQPQWQSFDVGGATATTAYGVNNHGEIVGSYRDAGGNTHGFLCR